MNISDIVTRVQRQFGDESGVQVTEADILRWINDAQNEAVLQHSNLLRASTTIATVANQQEYNLPSTLIDVFSIKFQDSGEISKRNLRYLSNQEMNEFLDNWEGTDFLGTPYVFTRGIAANSFRVFPVPDNALGTFTINYSRYAVDVVTTASIIDLPTYYHPYILEFCLMKAYEMDEEWEAVDRKAAYVQSTLDANFARDDWFGKKAYPTITTTSEDYV